MVEALVALLVLSLGLLALGHLLVRHLGENRVASARAVATQHIDALRDSIALNASADYSLDWQAVRVATVDCLRAGCSAAQTADHDLAAWRASLVLALPGADARVFRASPDARQTGIAVAWPASDTGAAAEAVPPLAGVECPANFLCHVLYFQP